MARKIQGPAEHDVFTGWRHVLAYLRQPGLKASVKRGARRRERRDGKKEARNAARLE